MVIRSKLYAPGNEPRKLAGVGKFGADAVILDLEDAVPVSEKETARQLVRETIPKVKQTTPHVYVRINPLGDKTSFSVGQGADDVEAIVCPGLDGIVVPKVESEKELDEIDAKLAAMETRVGLPVGILEVVPIIETAKGLWNAYEIATRIRRVRTLSLGAGDLTRGPEHRVVARRTGALLCPIPTGAYLARRRYSATHRFRLGTPCGR